MLPRTYPLVVQLYGPPRPQSNSTNLPARSPTCVNIYYEPPRSQQPQVSARNIRTYPLRIPTQEYNRYGPPPARINHASHNSVTNLPARNQSSISLTKLSRKGKKMSMQIHLQRTPVTALPVGASLRTARRTSSRPPGSVLQPSGAGPHNPLCCMAHRLAELLPPPGATPVKTLPYWFIHLQRFLCTFNH